MLPKWRPDGARSSVHFFPPLRKKKHTHTPHKTTSFFKDADSSLKRTSRRTSDFKWKGKTRKSTTLLAYSAQAREIEYELRPTTLTNDICRGLWLKQATPRTIDKIGGARRARSWKCGAFLSFLFFFIIIPSFAFFLFFLSFKRARQNWACFRPLFFAFPQTRSSVGYFYCVERRCT